MIKMSELVKIRQLIVNIEKFLNLLVKLLLDLILNIKYTKKYTKVKI